MTVTGRPALRGSRAHRRYSVIVFLILAALDNVAIGLVPPLYDPIGEALGVAEGTVAVVTAVSILVTAVAAVAWAYTGDRSNRKHLLMTGTVIWAAGVGATGYAGSFAAFLAAQVVAAVGLGAVASVGYSVVTDLISPRRRGLVMSLWGLSQGVGTLTGTALGGVLGAGDWQRPFRVLTVVGLVATVAYLFTYDIRRGSSEPELRAVFAAGGDYEHRISRADLPGIVGRRTNVWLVAQGLSAQVAFGALLWLPRLFQAKAEAIGYAREPAIVIGSVFAVMLQTGGVLSIVGGLVGDRMQRRTPRGRALVASVGMLAAVPLLLVVFFFPFHVDVPTDRGTAAIVLGVLGSVVTEPSAAVTLLVALVAIALISANAPNWYALTADVNPPEHRGTVFSAGNLANGVGRAAGNGLIGPLTRALGTALPPPANYALGLALSQLFFVPAGIMYWLASRTSPADIDTVSRMLRDRAAAAGGAAPSP